MSKIWRRLGWAKGVLCGGRKATQVAMASGEGEVAVETPKERRWRELKEQRLKTTCFTVAMGIVEGTSSTMTAALFVLLPLNPRVIGGLPIPRHYVMQMWVVQVR